MILFVRKLLGTGLPQGYPSPTRYIRIKTLARISCQSLERTVVRGKVLTKKELELSP